MAVRMALVPESWLEQANRGVKEEDPNQNKPNLFLTQYNQSQNSIITMAELLPKNLRNRAKVLLHYIDGKIRLSDQQRVIYEDGTTGSHLLDLVRYFTSPLTKTRPMDSHQFLTLLHKNGVPEHAIVNRSTGKDTNLFSNWKEI